METYNDNCDDVWIKLDGDVSIINNRTPAMVVNVEDNGMGWKKSDWSKFVSRFGTRKVVGTIQPTHARFRMVALSRCTKIPKMAALLTCQTRHV